MTEIQEVADGIYHSWFQFWPVNLVQARKLVNHLMADQGRTIKQEVVKELMKLNTSGKLHAKKKRQRREDTSPVHPETVVGKLYFINRETRLTRVWDKDCLPVPQNNWLKVSKEEYELFRKETKAGKK